MLTSRSINLQNTIQKKICFFSWPLIVMVGRTNYVLSKDHIHGIHSDKNSNEKEVVTIFVLDFTAQVSSLLSEWVPEAFTRGILFSVMVRGRFYEGLGPNQL